MDPLAPLTALRGVTSWRLDVPTLIVVLALAAWYLAGVRHVRRRGDHWSVWRSVSFLALGLGSIVVVMMSSLGVYDRILFWPRAVQYTVLLGVTPLLIATGEPIELARRCMSERSLQRMETVLRSRTVRAVCFPLVGALLDAVVLLIVFLTPLYHASLTDEAVHHLVGLGLLLIGCHFFVPQLDQGDQMLPDWCGYSLRVVLAFVDGLIDAIPGIVIMTMNGAIARSYYAGLDRHWGPTLHWDQVIGGGLIFTISEAAALPFLVVLFIRWVREDENLAKQIDLQLDREAAAEAVDTDQLPLSTRPWWETDPGPLAERGLQVPPSRHDPNSSG